MRKYKELVDQNSCLNKAFSKELLFVLIGRDEAAPDTIRFWAKKRIELNKNKEEDGIIQEALICAEQMEKELPAIFIAKRALAIVGL